MRNEYVLCAQSGGCAFAFILRTKCICMEDKLKPLVQPAYKLAKLRQIKRNEHHISVISANFFVQSRAPKKYIMIKSCAFTFCVVTFLLYARRASKWRKRSKSIHVNNEHMSANTTFARFVYVLRVGRIVGLCAAHCVAQQRFECSECMQSIAVMLIEKFAFARAQAMQ